MRSKKPGLIKSDSEITDWGAGTVVCAKRVRVQFGGETVADSTRTLLLRLPDQTPVYYFPKTDVRFDLLEPGAILSGVAHWSVVAGGRREEDAAWSYLKTSGPLTWVEGYVAFSWDQADHWLEEDEEIFVHPRDPFVRVDILDSSRDVRVVLGGETVAQSSSAKFLFETGLPARYYLPRSDVRTDILAPSATTTACPYKGVARYWSARSGGREWPDVVWSYDNPLPECEPIRGYLCFYHELVDGIFIDGASMNKPKMRENWL